MNNTIEHLPNGDFKVLNKAGTHEMSKARKVPEIPKSFTVSLPAIVNKAKRLGYAGVPILVQLFGMKKEQALSIISEEAKYEIHGNRLTIL